MITISDGILTIPQCERFVGFTGDNNHTEKTFFISNNTQSGWLYRLYLTFDDGRHNFFILPATVSSEGTWLTWNIEESHILKSGLVKAQIKAFSEDNEVYHTTSDVFVAGLSSEEADSFKNGNSEFILYERTLNNLYRKMITASAKMPYVGENGNWFVYDTDNDVYTDSGVSSSAGLADNSVTPAKLDRAYWEKIIPVSEPITDCEVLFNTVGFVNSGGSIAFVNAKIFVADMDTTINGFCYAVGVKFTNADTVYLINVTDGTMWKITRTNTGDEYVTIYTYKFEKNTDTGLIADGSVTPAKLDRTYWEKKAPITTQIIDTESLFDTVSFINSGGSISFVNLSIEVSDMNFSIYGFCYAVGVRFETIDTLYLINVSDGSMWKIIRTNTGDEVEPVYTYEYIKQGVDGSFIADNSIEDSKLKQNYWKRFGSVPAVGNDTVLASMLEDDVIPIVSFIPGFHEEIGEGPFAVYPKGNNCFSLCNLINAEIWNVTKLENGGLEFSVSYIPQKIDTGLIDDIDNKWDYYCKEVSEFSDLDILLRDLTVSTVETAHRALVRFNVTYNSTVSSSVGAGLCVGLVDIEYIDETPRLIFTNLNTGKSWSYLCSNEKSLALISGKDGKSAYEYAKEGGYSGTEEQFINEMNSYANKADKGFLYVSMPDYVNVLINSTFKIFYRNIFSRDDVILWVGYNNNLTTRYYDNYLSISANAEGTHTLPWKAFDKGYNLLDSGELSIIASAKIPSETTKAIVIGDSTVNAGVITAKAAELYASNNATLMCLGTRGDGTHEGRSGWTAKMYCTVKSENGIENPFYNNGFDFAYYMSNQNYSDIQSVVIQLGINDIFAFKDYDWALYDSSEVLEYIQQMVSSVLSYDCNIKVIINLPITPNSNGTSFTEAYGTTQLYSTYNRNIIRFAEELIEYFASNPDVTISASNCVLDTKTQINDGVHPSAEGYNELGKRLYEVLVSVTDGGVYIAPLLDVTQRTRVDYTDRGTITAASEHELDSTKCYDTAFNGVRGDSISTKITSYTPISANSFSLQTSSTGGYGLEFPVRNFEVGKSYTLKYTADISNMRVYLIKYNSDTTYNSNEMLSNTTGSFVKNITPEEGCIYSIFFGALTADTLCTFSEISLTEN